MSYDDDDESGKATREGTWEDACNRMAEDVIKKSAYFRRLLRIQNETIDRLSIGDPIPYTHSERNEDLAAAFKQIAAEIRALEVYEQQQRDAAERKRLDDIEDVKRQIAEAQRQLAALTKGTP